MKRSYVGFVARIDRRVPWNRLCRKPEVETPQKVHFWGSKVRTPMVVTENLGRSRRYFMKIFIFKICSK